MKVLLFRKFYPLFLIGGLFTGRSWGSTLFSEHFNSDVFSSGAWTRTDPSVTVDTGNGRLHIGTNGVYDAAAAKSLDLALPLVVEARARLVSGGSNYRLPAFHFYFTNSVPIFTNGIANNVYLTVDNIAWTFGYNPSFQNAGSIKRPASENVWVTIRLEINTNGGNLYAKFDSDTAFGFVSHKDWNAGNRLKRINLRQQWDSVCDFDYILVRNFEVGDGLIVYYPFNGNANDASGNGNNGTTNGVTSTQDRFGNANSAYSFDGVNDYIQAVSALPDSESLTFSGWIYLPSLSASGRKVFFEGNTTAGHDIGVSLTSGSCGFFTKDPVGEYILFPGSLLPIQAWFHFVAVADAQNDRKQIWINGQKIAETNWTTSANIGNHYNLQIGRLGDGSSATDYFYGKLDDLRFYNRALSSSQIQQLYTETAPPVLVSTNRLPTSPEKGGGTIPTDNHLKVFTNSAFQANAVLYSDRMTIVLTHGWNSNPDGWAVGMANRLAEKIGTNSANLVAWDWRTNADKGGPLTAQAYTAGEGDALGKALIQSLGSNYSHAIHFIGHSLGTLVNARAADYLHTPGRFNWQNTHMTLLDEAEIAPKIVNYLLAKELAAIGYADPPDRLFSDKPLPKQKGWADNYISLVGIIHHDAANLLLTKQQSYLNPVEKHAYAYNWYSNSIWETAGTTSVMGNRWSFERDGITNAPTIGSVYVQSFLGASDMDVTPTNLIAATVQSVQNLARFAEAKGYQLLEKVKDGVAKVNGAVQTAIQSADLNDPQAGLLTSGSIWSPQFTLQTTAGAAIAPNGPIEDDGPENGGGNNPACVWANVTVPSNALSMSFDFILQGDGKDDLFSAAIDGTNVLSIETSLLETNELVNSGPIDITQWAGQEMELFFGITGGTSSNAIVTVQAIRFYENIPPILAAQLDGTNIVLSWPLFSAVQLQATVDLGNTNSWAAVTNIPSLVNLQNTVTNPVAGAQRFFRLGPNP